jgi:hypothetical protein
LKGDSEQVGYVPLANELVAEGYTPDREVKSERTENTKIFLNEDGTRTAIMDNKPIHYRDALGNLQDIDLNIVPSIDSEYAYKSEKHLEDLLHG